MKRWAWALLIFELALFALILILPQVDLPDFTFHGGTAPVVMKARLSPSTLRLAVFTVAQLFLAMFFLSRRTELAGETPLSALQPRLSLLCTLLC